MLVGIQELSCSLFHYIHSRRNTFTLLLLNYYFVPFLFSVSKWVPCIQTMSVRHFLVGFSLDVLVFLSNTKVLIAFGNTNASQSLALEVHRCSCRPFLRHGPPVPNFVLCQSLTSRFCAINNLKLYELFML